MLKYFKNIDILFAGNTSYKISKDTIPLFSVRRAANNEYYVVPDFAGLSNPEFKLMTSSSEEECRNFIINAYEILDNHFDISGAVAGAKEDNIDVENTEFVNLMFDSVSSVSVSSDAVTGSNETSDSTLDASVTSITATSMSTTADNSTNITSLIDTVKLRILHFRYIKHRLIEFIRYINKSFDFGDAQYITDDSAFNYYYQKLYNSIIQTAKFVKSDKLDEICEDFDYILDTASRLRHTHVTRNFFYGNDTTYNNSFIKTRYGPENDDVTKRLTKDKKDLELHKQEIIAIDTSKLAVKALEVLYDIMKEMYSNAGAIEEIEIESCTKQCDDNELAACFTRTIPSLTFDNTVKESLITTTTNSITELNGDCYCDKCFVGQYGIFGNLEIPTPRDYNAVIKKHFVTENMKSGKEFPSVIFPEYEVEYKRIANIKEFNWDINDDTVLSAIEEHIYSFTGPRAFYKPIGNLFKRCVDFMNIRIKAVELDNLESLDDAVIGETIKNVNIIITTSELPSMVQESVHTVINSDEEAKILYIYMKLLSKVFLRNEIKTKVFDTIIDEVNKYLSHETVSEEWGIDNVLDIEAY